MFHREKAISLILKGFWENSEILNNKPLHFSIYLVTADELSVMKIRRENGIKRRKKIKERWKKNFDGRWHWHNERQGCTKGFEQSIWSSSFTKASGIISANLLSRFFSAMLILLERDDSVEEDIFTRFCCSFRNDLLIRCIK